MADFKASLSDAAPAPALSPSLSALWWAAKGNWAEGSVFVVRDDGRLIAATTTPEPTVGLVFYDLKSCLRAAAPEDPPKPQRRVRQKADGA